MKRNLEKIQTLEKDNGTKPFGLSVSLYLSDVIGDVEALNLGLRPMRDSSADN